MQRVPRMPKGPKGSVGGVIAAASRKSAYPMKMIGSIPAVKRIVLTLQQAGVFPIVVITGVEAGEVRFQLADHGVIFHHNETCEEPELLDSFKIGLSYLKNRCDKVVLTPVNVPMFTPDTVRVLLEADAGIVTPVCNGMDGHPVVLSSAIYDAILSHAGGIGLRSAIEVLMEMRLRVTVEDRGVLCTVHDDSLKDQLDSHNMALLHPFVRLSIEKESSFFNARAKLLLLLIDETSSVRSASGLMALSYSKAWEMLNRLEDELGYAVVTRRHGGSRGGRTSLTDRGRAFLQRYQNFEDSVCRYAREKFEELFLELGETNG